MKNSNIKTIGYNLFVLAFLFLITSCNNNAKKEKTEVKPIEEVKETYWNVKAIQPDGKSLDIKIFDAEGKAYDVKSIQNSDQDNFLDVKAIVSGEKLPVKILVSNDQYAPVTAISKTGDSYDLKAVTPEGKMLEVKGVARFGYIVIMKAITESGALYPVKAVSPTGQLNDVKGIKINHQEREMTSRGLSIYAHVKAMHPAENEDKFKIPERREKKKNTKIVFKSNFKRIMWNIKAVTTDGKNLDVKAIDAEGNAFDVKATQDSKQHSLMNIKAFVEGAELPIKIMDSPDEYAPIKAIGTDGTIYDIKALTEDKVKLDVKGVSRSGNIINVKAVNENGNLYAVKAFAPDGKLNQVKGIKIFDRKIEMKVQGNPVYAHLKAIK